MGKKKLHEKINVQLIFVCFYLNRHIFSIPQLLLVVKGKLITMKGGPKRSILETYITLKVSRRADESPSYKRILDFMIFIKFIRATWKIT